MCHCTVSNFEHIVPCETINSEKSEYIIARKMNSHVDDELCSKGQISFILIVQRPIMQTRIPCEVPASVKPRGEFVFDTVACSMGVPFVQ